jgi:hypothetical protein
VEAAAAEEEGEAEDQEILYRFSIHRAVEAAIALAEEGVFHVLRG